MEKKKILYLAQFFRHPGEPGGTRVYWIAQELIKQGYHVTVITQKNSFNPENKNEPCLQRTNIDGIEIVYIKNPYSNEFSYLKRVYVFIRFMVKSTWHALKEKDVSLVIATSTPLSIGVPALAMKIFRKVPFVFEIRDLWPEVPIQMGIIKNQVLKTSLRKFERLLYKKAAHVVALSPGMAEGVKNHIPKEKLSVIPNMAKIDKFWPREKNQVFAQRIGLPDNSFKIIHFGAFGVANGLQVFINAALEAKKNEIRGLDFVMVGSGKMKEQFKSDKEKLKLDNLFIFDRMAMDEISELVNLCDLSYVGFSPVPILETNSANKFFDSLSAGKPILLNFGGWMQEIIENGECGLRVDAINPVSLLGKILFLKENNDLRIQMGKNARKLAEDKFDKSILCPQFANIVNNLFEKL